MSSLYLRNKTWWYKTYQKGIKIQRSLNTTSKTEAKARQIQLDAQYSEFIQPNKISWQDFIADWKRYCESQKSRNTYIRDYKVINQFTRNTNPRTLSDVTPQLLQEYFNRRAKEVHPRTVNRFVEVIKALLNYATKQGCLFKNPADCLNKIKTPKHPLRFLTKEEIDLILQESKKTDLFLMIATCIYAGLRFQELINLEWQDIDFKENHIKVLSKPNAPTKTKEYRIVPLSSRLKEMLKPLTQNSGKCFPAYNYAISKSFGRILSKCEFNSDVTWIALRRTFGSQLAQAGVSLLKISKWMGHADPRTTMQHYAHLLPQYDADIEKMFVAKM